MSMAWRTSVTQTKQLLEEWHACYSHVDSDWFIQEKLQATKKTQEERESIFLSRKKCIKLKGKPQQPQQQTNKTFSLDEKLVLINDNDHHSEES